MIRLWPLVVLLVGSACTKSNELPDEAWAGIDYASAGLQIDKPWTPDDYAAAAKVLEKVTAGHRERLPRFRGKKSGAIFAKLLVDLPDDLAQPIDRRFIAHFTRGEALNALAKLYLPNQLDTPPREWIELMGASLREAAVLATDADAFVASFGADDPKRANRLEGLEKMKAGNGSMLLGGLLVADQLRLSEDDRVAMLQHVTAGLPVLFPRAPVETQQQIRNVLAKQVAGFPAGKLRDAAVAAQQGLPK